MKGYYNKNTLFLCITTGILFILSLKKQFSNYVAITIDFCNPFCNSIPLFTKTCKTLDITYKL